MSVHINPAEELKKKTKKAIIANAFMRIESALTISLTVLLIVFLPQPFARWHWWYWLILGGVAELLIVITSLTDQTTANQVVTMVLREEYDPAQIKTNQYRELVERALLYRQYIEQIISLSSPGVLRDHLYDSTAGIAEWINKIYDLARRLDVYARDEVIHRDLQQAPAEVTGLLNAISHEDNPETKAQIQSALAAAQEHWNNLRTLDNKMEQAQYRLQETVTSLGTVYSQFQLIFAQKLSGAEAQRLSADIKDQVQRLQDILATMQEVYTAAPVV